MSFLNKLLRFLEDHNQVLFHLSLFLLLAGILAAGVSPSEKTIGKALALVYLHIGFFVGSLALFFFTVLVSLLLPSEKARRVLTGSFYNAGGVAWFIYFLFSAAVAYVSWGGIYWQEPRMIIAVRVIFLFLLAQAINYFFEKRYQHLIFGSGAFLSILIWLFRFSIFHPKAPIRESNSLSIKLFAVASIVSTALSIILLAAAAAGRDLKNDRI